MLADLLPARMGAGGARKSGQGTSPLQVPRAAPYALGEPLAYDYLQLNHFSISGAALSWGGATFFACL